MTPPDFHWTDSTEKRYTEQLGAVPPRAWGGDMFLMGEAMDYTPDGQLTYTVHARIARDCGGPRRYVVGSLPITAVEFINSQAPNDAAVGDPRP